MKRILVLAILALVVCTSVFASDDYFNASQLIDKKLDADTVSLVQRYAVNLSNDEKVSLYEANKSKPALPVVLNAFLGMGIGSFVQGDYVGGAVLLADEALCMSLTINALANIMNPAISQEQKDRYSVQLSICSLCAVAGRVAECIRPFFYSKAYNKRLAKALYGGGPTVAFVPFFDENGEASVTMTARIPLN